MYTPEDVESLAAHAYVAVLHEGARLLEVEIERQRAIHRRLIEEILRVEESIQ